MSHSDLILHVKEDMVQALGCTEPGIISLASARAAGALRERFGEADGAAETEKRLLFAGKISAVEVKVSSGIYKNAYSCGIPGTVHSGSEYAAAIGAVGGRPERGLTVLSGLSEAEIRAAWKLRERGLVTVSVGVEGPGIYVSAVVTAAGHRAEARIVGSHVSDSFLAVDGEVIYRHETEQGQEEREGAALAALDFAAFRACADAASQEELSFIGEAVDVNLTLASEGIAWERCTITGALLKGLPEEVRRMVRAGKVPTGSGIDPQSYARLLTAAAIEARFLGAGAPAVSVVGSGAHGIICTLPIAAAARLTGAGRGRMLRAIFLNTLVTAYVKEYSGRLSAFCGCGIAGGLGLSYALGYLEGAEADVSERAFANMSSSVTGMLCTGGNQACAMKALSAVDAAFTAHTLALAGAGIGAYTGIVSFSPEQTARNVGRIADPGMLQTDRTILDLYLADAKRRKGGERQEKAGDPENSKKVLAK
ncbi:MAG: serine dehydratase subunit alpha family protein [Lachnospiraceae bacterium]|nr:serine dehydratase subunit alpha family protein [Lachnospiraceae bacterium]